MKKKGKTIVKNIKTPSSKTKINEKIKIPVRKVMVGEDEFCPTCMEWRFYNETTGKCTVCGCLIKKIHETKKIIEEYDLKDFSNNHDELQEPDEF